MRDVGILAVLLMLFLWGCGGEQTAATTELLDGAVEAAPLFQNLYPRILGGEDVLSFQCLSAALPVGDNGLPNCVVVSAGFPEGGTPEQVEACEQCDAPGLEPFI